MDQPSAKLAPKFSALPPPGHNQWDNIAGNENGTPVRGVVPQSRGPSQTAANPSISPLAKDLVGYRLAAGSDSQAQGSWRAEPAVSEDWYSDSGSNLSQAVQAPSVTQPKRLLGACETDFTKVEKKKTAWSLTPFDE